jgi:hypothetical protein
MEPTDRLGLNFTPFLSVKKGAAISDPRVGGNSTANNDDAVTTKQSNALSRCDPRHKQQAQHSLEALIW